MGIRLKVIAFDGVRESAEALGAGMADLAVVLPDVALPGNAMTLAVLRELSAFVEAPAGSGIKGFSDLAGKGLGMLASRTADRTLVGTLVAHHDLELLTEAQTGAVPKKAVSLVHLVEGDIGPALRDHWIDALVMVTTPTSALVKLVVALVKDDGEDEEVAVFGLSNATAVLARWPRLQAVTLPAALFGGNPRLPAEDVATVGSSYRLVARADLSCSLAAEVTQHLFEMRRALANMVPEADAITHPAY